MNKATLVPLVGLALVSARAAVLGGSVADALILAALGATYVGMIVTELKKQPDINADLKKELDDMKTSLAAIKLGKSFGR